MSRIGRAPITIPAGVTVTVEDGNVVTVKGPKGTLTQTLSPIMNISVDNGVVTVARADDEKQTRSLHGLTRALLNNMVRGVTEGFSKELEINGVGYRAQKEGKNLVMNLGYSHLVTVPEIDGITIDVPNPNKVVINGIDKQRVGQYEADPRLKGPPAPYNGPGMTLVDEVILRKEGKTGK